MEGFYSSTSNHNPMKISMKKNLDLVVDVVGDEQMTGNQVWIIVSSLVLLDGAAPIGIIVAV